MGKQKKQTKLNFIPIKNDLTNDININTITQFITTFKYVENWGKKKSIKDNLPSDSINVIAFFRSIKKLSSKGFHPKKFYDIWKKYDMENIIDYKLTAMGVSEKLNEDDY